MKSCGPFAVPYSTRPQGIAKHSPWMLTCVLFFITLLALPEISAEETSDTAYRERVTQAYRNALDREPDPDGMAAYVQHLEEGMSDKNLLSVLQDSPEGLQVQAERARERKARWTRWIITGSLIALIAFSLYKKSYRILWLALLIALAYNLRTIHPKPLPRDMRQWRARGDLTQIVFNSESRYRMMNRRMAPWHAADPFTYTTANLYRGRQLHLEEGLFHNGLLETWREAGLDVIAVPGTLDPITVDTRSAFAHFWYNPLIFSPADYPLSRERGRKKSHYVMLEHGPPPNAKTYPTSIFLFKPPSKDDSDIVSLRSERALYIMTRHQLDTLTFHHE